MSNIYVSYNNITSSLGFDSETVVQAIREEKSGLKLVDDKAILPNNFYSSLINREAGITNDPPIRGVITLSGEKYNLDYLGNTFIFDGKKLVVINQDEKEVSINSGNLDEEDGFIYPSKLLTFYKEGYNYQMGALKNSNGRKVQYIELTPIDSNSDIVKVQLGIDAKTKHIYKLTQIGSNGAETTFTITKFKSNQPISAQLFSFDRTKYAKQGYYID